MPGLLVSSPDKYELDAHNCTYSCSDGGLKLNSSHSTPLPPSESLTLLRLTSVASGSGVAAMARSSFGAIDARKWRHRRVERKGIFSDAKAIRFVYASRTFRNPYLSNAS